MKTEEMIEPTNPTPPPDGIEAVMADLTAWLRPLIEGWLARGGATEPRWVRVGGKVFDYAKATDVVMTDGFADVFTPGSEVPTRFGHGYADALWAYVTDPARCVDLTPKPDATP